MDNSSGNLIPKPGSPFMIDPANGALVIRPECKGKIERSIWREFRRAEFRAKVNRFCLRFLVFEAEARYAVLRAIYYIRFGRFVGN